MRLYNAAGKTLAPKIPREVTALIAALRLREPDNALLNELTECEWKSLLVFCDLAHLTLLLAQLPGEAIPRWVVERVRTNANDNALRFDRIKTTYIEVADVLRCSGIDHVVIKGFTQSPDYVPDPKDRVQSDIDLYCPSITIESAVAALKSIGYKASEGIDYSQADHTPTMLRLGDWTWSGNLFDPQMPLSLELHFCLWNEKVLLFPIPEVEAFWNRRTTRHLDGLEFWCLNDVDHLGYLALHILRNLLPGYWIIHHVRELAVFLHSHAQDDALWARWNETHSFSLRSFEAIAFYHARAWFNCDLHERAAEAIEHLPITQRRWLDRFVGSSLEGMFHQNKDSVWLHLTFLHSMKARVKLIHRAFIPKHVSGMNSTAVRFENRQARGSNGAHPLRRYISYLASRAASYSYLSAVTIARGIRWRFL